MTPDLERYDSPGYVERLEGQQARLADVLRRFGVVPGRNPDGVNDDPEKAALVIEGLKAENAEMRRALRRIDDMLTTVEGDNVPRGDAPKMHARMIARTVFKGAAARAFQ